MQTMQLKQNFYWCGVLDKDLRIFDIIIPTEYGTTYNSYLLKTNDGDVLFETVKDHFCDQHIENVQTLTDISNIKYLVVNHTEPDHSGSVAKWLDINPEITVIGSAMALNFLAQIINKPFKSYKAMDKAELIIGDKTLRFVSTPNLHWPDTMLTYIVEDKTLVSCDVLGGHYCFEPILASKLGDKLQEYIDAEKYYFEHIMRPFATPFILNAIAKIEQLAVDMICPGHGVVHDCDIDTLLERQKHWSLEQSTFHNKTAVVVYVSAYGYTQAMAEKIAEGIRSQNIDVIMHDLSLSDKTQVIKDINACQALAVGTPTILADALKPIWDILTDLYKPILGKKPAFAFGSYGWSGEGVANVTARLTQLGLAVEDGLRIKFNPSEQELQDCYDKGVELAQKIK